MGNGQERWLRTDEHLEAVLSLEAVARFSRAVDGDLHSWRWVILALHNAAQGFMVVSLRFGNGLLALRNDIARKWLEAYNNDKPYPPEKLDSFLGLYGKVQDRTKLHYVHSQAFAPQGSEDASIKRLNSLRNEFIHFLPRRWSLEVSGLPRISLDCLRLIEFLAWNSGGISWHNEELMERTQRTLRECRTEFTRIEVVYGAAG